MPFYISCSNCHRRNPDRRNKKHGNLELAYFLAWRMMGYAFHVRYSMIIENSFVPKSLGELVKIFDPNDICAWNVMLLYQNVVSIDPQAKNLLDASLRTVERVYNAEQFPYRLSTCCGGKKMKPDQFDAQVLVSLLKRKCPEERLPEIEPLVEWYLNQKWFSAFAAKMLRSIRLATGNSSREQIVLH